MARSGSLRVLVGVAIACGLFATSVSAQITTGSVTGVVTDAQSGVIPGASVVLISETQGTRSAAVVTSADGTYTMPNVKADTYSVEVSMPSFKNLMAPRSRSRSSVSCSCTVWPTLTLPSFCRFGTPSR